MLLGRYSLKDYRRSHTHIIDDIEFLSRQPSMLRVVGSIPAGRAIMPVSVTGNPTVLLATWGTDNGARNQSLLVLIPVERSLHMVHFRGRRLSDGLY